MSLWIKPRTRCPNTPNRTLLPQALTLLPGLADPIRLQVVEALARDRRCVCELIGALTLVLSQLSFHLKVLTQA